MPIMKSGAFRSYTDLRAKIDGQRNIASAILRLAAERGIQNYITEKAAADIREADSLEKEYFE